MQEAKELSYRFNEDVYSKECAAKSTCRVWTKTQCETFAEMKPALEKYARLKAAKDRQIPAGNPSADDLAGLKTLEEYRVAGIAFWYEAFVRNFPMGKYSVYPNHHHMRTFSTFHWALYMTNNRCACKPGTEGQEPATYMYVLNELRKAITPPPSKLTFYEHVQRLFCAPTEGAAEETAAEREIREIRTRREEMRAEFPNMQKDMFGKP